MASVWRWMTACGIGLTVGCASSGVIIPEGHRPPSTSNLDALSSTVLWTPKETPKSPEAQAEPKKSVFELPATLPGADAPPLKPLHFEKDTPFSERENAVNAAYPPLKPVGGTGSFGTEGTPLGLGELQQLAIQRHPMLKQAVAEADAAFGQVLQAGLSPNPTLGYQADQWQPGSKPYPENNNGQQGMFINQLIKTAGKLTLAQQVVGYDYINALVAVRKTQVEVMSNVRGAYFAALVARQGVETNQAIAAMADDVYRLQLKQVMAGEAAGYEPLQLYAQAIQARNALVQSEANFKSAWKQLAAAVGEPSMGPRLLGGRADVAPPVFDADTLTANAIEQHTDVLTAKNLMQQAQTNLVLQQRIPIPDLQLNNYHQYDTIARNYQFGIQLGVTLPTSDANQGNIHSARAKIAATGQQANATRNALQSKLAEALGRYEANTQIAANFRDRVLPSLSQSYRALIRRFQVEPEKVGFNDIVVAQQNYAQALQGYLQALEGQWKSVVDVAGLAQLDEIYPDVK
jgi:outer membrane protein, heavy metal efflux system